MKFYALLMSEEQLKAFREKVKGDTSLQSQLRNAADHASVMAIAKSAGFVISNDALPTASANISDEELEAISGGGCSAWSINSVGTFTCLV